MDSSMGAGAPSEDIAAALRAAKAADRALRSCSALDDYGTQGLLSIDARCVREIMAATGVSLGLAARALYRSRVDRGIAKSYAMATAFSGLLLAVGARSFATCETDTSVNFIDSQTSDEALAREAAQSGCIYSRGAASAASSASHLRPDARPLVFSRAVAGAAPAVLMR